MCLLWSVEAQPLAPQLAELKEKMNIEALKTHIQDTPSEKIDTQRNYTTLYAKPTNSPKFLLQNETNTSVNKVQKFKRKPKETKIKQKETKKIKPKLNQREELYIRLCEELYIRLCEELYIRLCEELYIRLCENVEHHLLY